MQADFILDYDVLTVQQEHRLYLMARLNAGPMPNEKRRRPLNLGLVIDRSGSMAGEKIAHTRHAAQFLVQHLGHQDTLSIVLYNDAVEVLALSEPVRNKDLLMQRVGNIKVSGTTNLSGGWLEGCKLVAQKKSDEFLNRVILMSDGHANRGVTDIDKLVALAGQKHEQGVSTTTMGLGDGFNEELMMQMAEAGGGAFYFIESPEVAPEIFNEELQGLLNAVGQNLVVSVEPNVHVREIKQLNAYPMQVDGRRTSYRLGDIFGEEIKTLVLELSVPAMEEVGEKEIGTLRFEYDELTESGSEHRVNIMPIVVNVAAQGELPAQVNPDVQRSVLLLKAANARRRAVEAADEGEYHRSSRILREGAEALKKAGVDDEQIDEEHAALMQQATDMERGAEYFGEFNRKMMATQAFYTMTDRHTGTVTLRRREMSRSQPDGEEPPTVKRDGKSPSHVTWNEHTHELERPLLRIGRAQQNEIVIAVRGVSRFHCQIRREGDELILEDLGSTNGTFIDGISLHRPHVLRAGDEIFLYDQKLHFHMGDLEPAPEPEPSSSVTGHTPEHEA